MGVFRIERNAFLLIASILLALLIAPLTTILLVKIHFLNTDFFNFAFFLADFGFFPYLWAAMPLLIIPLFARKKMVWAIPFCISLSVSILGFVFFLFEIYLYTT